MKESSASCHLPSFDGPHTDSHGLRGAVVERCRACHSCEAACLDAGKKFLGESDNLSDDRRRSGVEKVEALLARLDGFEKLLDDLQYRFDVMRKEAVNVEALRARLDGFEKLLEDSRYRSDDNSQKVEDSKACIVAAQKLLGVSENITSGIRKQSIGTFAQDLSLPVAVVGAGVTSQFEVAPQTIAIQQKTARSGESAVQVASLAGDSSHSQPPFEQ